MYFLFDLGGTKTRCAISRDGKVFERTTIVPTPQDYGDGIDMFATIKRELENVPEGFTAVVGSAAASLSEDGASLAGGGPQIKNWLNKPLRDDLSALFQAPVHIENDAMMGGLAQAHFGPAQGHGISAYLTVSTGVGGARIVDGKIDRHTFGFEPGWQTIDAGNALCNGWSTHGLLADYVSGMGIAKNTGAEPETIHDAAFWRSRAELLALGLYNLTLFWSPEIIVVGGSIIQSLPLDHVEETYRGMLGNIFPSRQPQLVRAHFGDEMGLWGALAYIKAYDIAPSYQNNQ